jgi:hypothetical protein
MKKDKLHIIIKENEWREFVNLPLFENKYIEKGVYNLKKEMRNLGYMNDENEVVLSKNFPLNGFWNNFNYAFSKEIIDLIFKRMEETIW